jgi:hypothetical protein
MSLNRRGFVAGLVVLGAGVAGGVELCRRGADLAEWWNGEGGENNRQLRWLPIPQDGPSRLEMEDHPYQEFPGGPGVEYLRRTWSTLGGLTTNAETYDAQTAGLHARGIDSYQAVILRTTDAAKVGVAAPGDPNEIFAREGDNYVLGCRVGPHGLAAAMGRVLSTGVVVASQTGSLPPVTVEEFNRLHPQGAWVTPIDNQH